MNQDPIKLGKAMIKAELGRELAQKVAKLREEQPNLTLQAAFGEVKKREPALFAYIARVEANNWGPAPRPSLVHAAKKPAVRSRPKDDDREVYIVYASDGSVAGLELS